MTTLELRCTPSRGEKEPTVVGSGGDTSRWREKSMKGRHRRSAPPGPPCMAAAALAQVARLTCLLRGPATASFIPNRPPPPPPN
jgi:hypothetical protein